MSQFWKRASADKERGMWRDWASIDRDAGRVEARITG